MGTIATEASDTGITGDDRGPRMQHCETCGNSYDHLLEIRVDGTSHFFDCFECAIHAMAPICGHCGVRVIGHGVQVDSTVYCCANCADMEEAAAGVRDRV